MIDGIVEAPAVPQSDRADYPKRARNFRIPRRARDSEVGGADGQAAIRSDGERAICRREPRRRN